MAAAAAEPVADPADRRRAVRPLEHLPGPRDVVDGARALRRAVRARIASRSPKPLSQVSLDREPLVESTRARAAQRRRGHDTVRELVHRQAESSVCAEWCDVHLGAARGAGRGDVRRALERARRRSCRAARAAPRARRRSPSGVRGSRSMGAVSSGPAGVAPARECRSRRIPGSRRRTARSRASGARRTSSQRPSSDSWRTHSQPRSPCRYRLDGDQRGFERGDGAVDVGLRRAPARDGDADRRRALPTSSRPSTPRRSPARSSRTRVRRLVVLEAEEHLVDDDVVQQLAAGKLLDAAANCAREIAAAVDEVGERPRARGSAARRRR